MGSALPGIMQITLAMRSVADHGRRPLNQCLPAMRCTRENNDKHSQRSVGDRHRRGQLCTSRNGMVGLNERGGRVTYFNRWQARDARRWALPARPHDIPPRLRPDMKGFRQQTSRYLRSVCAIVQNRPTFLAGLMQRLSSQLPLPNYPTPPGRKRERERVWAARRPADPDLASCALFDSKVGKNGSG